MIATHVPLNTELIKQLRMRSGMSMADAARRAGMRSAQQWEPIETGKNGNPTILTLQRIARALGVEPADLLMPLEGDEWKEV